MPNSLDLKIYEFAEFRVDVNKRQLTKGGEPIPLTPKVFDTLLYLVRHGGNVIEKDELMREIWPDSVVEENNLNQNISILRRVFGEKPGEQRFIVTIAGHGYRFAPEVKKSLGAEVVIDESAAESEIAEAESAATWTPSKIQHRKWLAALAALSLVVLSIAGIYLWRGKQESIDRPFKSVAVLPFKPLVIENRNEALEFGMAHTLIAKLSEGDSLIVRPLSAVRRYSSVEQDSLKAGRELGVETILDGTIQTWGNRIRISAKLLRTSDGKQLWTGQFDEKSTDIFIVQDSISEKVAAALKIQLGANQKRHSTENVEAYQLYMTGRYHIDKLTASEIRKSIPYFQQAIDKDPGYALAYTGLSQAFGVLAINGDMPVAEAFSKGRAAENKALEIDPTLGEAHIALCMGMFWHDWDWHGAEIECIKGLQISPNNADFHGHYAALLSSTGRHDEALVEARRSRELNPLNLAQNALEGQFLLHAGRSDEALAQLQKTSQLEPNFFLPHLFAASAYIEKGMFAEAIAESRKEYELSGGNVIPFGVYALAKSGKRDDAKAALNGLLKLSQTQHVPPYNIALIYNSLDMRDNALDWLEKAYEQRDPKMTFLKVEPKWNNLRNEPRFVELIKRMKFQ